MIGRDVEIDVPWHETRILNGLFCDKMIAGRYWQDAAYPTGKFCEPACADVKRRLVCAPRPNASSRQPERA